MTDVTPAKPALQRVLLVLLIVGLVGMLVHLVLDFTAAEPPRWTKAFLPLTFLLLGTYYVAWPNLRGQHAGTLRAVGIFMIAVALFSLLVDFVVHRA